MGNPIKILVLGSGGMLGSQVFKGLSKIADFEVLGTNRSTDALPFDPLVCAFVGVSQLVAGYDYVINCIGVIKPAINPARIDEAIYINSVFPHQLARCCEEENTKLIHISTDCVYSGTPKLPNTTNSYVEVDLHDASDVYGKSKSLGDPSNCMTLRTSIIGREFRNHRSLVSWFLSQENECDGFTNHFWNGITTNEYAKICGKIILNDWYAVGLYHIFSGHVTKFELLSLLKRKYKKEIKINPVLAGQEIDRTLGTTKKLCAKLQIPSISKMIKEMEL